MSQQLGYACVDGAFDGKPAEVVDWTNIYVAWAFYGYYKGDSTASWMARMKKCVDRVAKTTNLNFYLGLFGQLPANFTGKQIRAIFGLMQPWWNRVRAIDIADEPAWGKQETKDNLAKVRDILSSMKLPYKPLGITYTPEQMVGGSDGFGLAHLKNGKLVGPDFVNLELYSDRLHGFDQGRVKNLGYVKGNIQKAWSLLDPSTRCWYWLQGYDRNGAFVNIQNLADFQTDTYNLVKADARTEGFTIFNWARGTQLGNTGQGRGTKYMPDIEARHMQIGQDMGLV